MGGALAVQRGCGRRIKGGVYAEVGTGGRGVPLEAGIIDPPIPIDPISLGVGPRGVKLTTILGVSGSEHSVLIDWIGSADYPNVLDFLEEARRFGISRRLPRNIDFMAIGPETHLSLVHSRAFISNPAIYWDHVNLSSEGESWCPCEKPQHRQEEYREADRMCAALWWEDVQGKLIEPGTSSRVVRRRMPAFEYLARCAPMGASPEYHPALFFQWPIYRIVIVRDPEGGSHESVIERAERAGVPVALVDE